MKTIIIKNVDTVDHTYAGQLISAGTDYTIQSEYERQQFAKNTLLNQHLWAGTALAVVNDGSNDLSAVNGDAWLKNTTALPSDIDGVPLSRTKITKTGWHFQAQTIEFITSKLDSVYNKDKGGNDLGFVTIKYYDSNDSELISPSQATLDSDCVKTIVDWEPNHDYEIIGGTLYQSAAPTSNVRLWIIAVPDLTPAQGGSIPFTQGGLNLKHMGTGPIIELDGKTPKLMGYNATYHTNKFQLIVKHDAGDQYPLMLVFKLFKA